MIKKKGDFDFFKDVKETTMEGGKMLGRTLIGLGTLAAGLILFDKTVDIIAN